METTTSANQHSITLEKREADIWSLAESSRYGINMLVLALVVIPGSMAAPFAVNLGDWQFALVLFPTVFSLILVLGLAPLRLIVYTAAFALVANLVVFLAGALG
jgi:hypothetical protein